MTFEETLNLVRRTPYGRNANREDFSLVISENKGTCSSKHAYLKQFANDNNVPNVRLFIGLYKMTEQNTNISNILSRNNLEYLPEAHCYLKIDNEIVDVTTINSDFGRIRDSLIEEIEIEPWQVGDFKVNYHKSFITKWINVNNVEFSFDDIWKIREECISYLSDKIELSQ